MASLPAFAADHTPVAPRRTAPMPSRYNHGTRLSRGGSGALAGQSLMQRSHTVRPTRTPGTPTACRPLSSMTMKRRPKHMTKRTRNRMTDLALAGLVILACLGSAAVTLAGKL